MNQIDLQATNVMFNRLDEKFSELELIQMKQKYIEKMDQLAVLRTASTQGGLNALKQMDSEMVFNRIVETYASKKKRLERKNSRLNRDENYA